jgi:hypothetical protein
MGDPTGLVSLTTHGRWAGAQHHVRRLSGPYLSEA